MIFWTRLGPFLILSVISFAQDLPPGTAIPIQVRTGLNANKDRVGKRIEGRVMQEVPLPDTNKIKDGSRVTGHIVRITKQPQSGSSIVVRFDAIEDGKHTVALSVYLLALASGVSVDQAHSPINITSNLDPPTQWVTRQVGGDVVNRGRGKAASPNGTVGRWLHGSSVMIRLTPDSAAGCPSGPGYDVDQAVWIFSSAACGTYGFSNLNIANSGGTPPLGDIVLQSAKNVEIRSGSGWLLMSVSKK
jgi:hypothetical protein